MHVEIDVVDDVISTHETMWVGLPLPLIDQPL